MRIRRSADAILVHADGAQVEKPFVVPNAAVQVRTPLSLIILENIAGRRRMDEGYLIDQNKLAKIARKHDVTLREMVEICERSESEIRPDPAGHEERYMMQGVTGVGRALRVICADEDQAAAVAITRLITAFEWKRS